MASILGSFEALVTLAVEAKNFVNHLGYDEVGETAAPKANENSIKEELSKTAKVAEDRIVATLHEVAPLKSRKVNHYGTFSL